MFILSSHLLNGHFVCHGFKTKICTRLLLISNLSIQYSDFAFPMDIQKKDVNCFYYVLSVHIKK